MFPAVSPRTGRRRLPRDPCPADFKFQTELKPARLRPPFFRFVLGVGVWGLCAPPPGLPAQDAPCSVERGSRPLQFYSPNSVPKDPGPPPRIEVRFLGNAICPDAWLYSSEQGGQSGGRRAGPPAGGLPLL